MKKASFLDIHQRGSPIVIVRNSEQEGNPKHPASERITISVSGDGQTEWSTTDIKVEHGRQPTMTIGGVTLSTNAWLTILLEHLTLTIAPPAIEAQQLQFISLVDTEICNKLRGKATRIIEETLFPGEIVPSSFSLTFVGDTHRFTVYARCPLWRVSTTEGKGKGGHNGTHILDDNIQQGEIDGMFEKPSVKLLDLCKERLASEIVNAVIVLVIDKRKAVRSATVNAIEGSRT